MPPHQRGIGMVFQNYALWPHMTVFDNVAYGLKLRKLPHAEIEDAGRRGAGEGEARRAWAIAIPGQLSGGQQQRVALARALVLNPEILLLDEPLSNLDAKIRIQVRAEIRKLQKELGITTIYVTHDQEEALTLSDRIAVFDHGKVLQVGPPKDLYERPAEPLRGGFHRHQQHDRGHRRSRSPPTQGAAGEDRRWASSRPARCAAQAPGDPCVRVHPAGEHLTSTATARRATTSCRGSVVFRRLSRQHAALRRGPGRAASIFKADMRDPWHHKPFPMGSAGGAGLPRRAAPWPFRRHR